MGILLYIGVSMLGENQFKQKSLYYSIHPNLNTCILKTVKTLDQFNYPIKNIILYSISREKVHNFMLVKTYLPSLSPVWLQFGSYLIGNDSLLGVKRTYPYMYMGMSLPVYVIPSYKCVTYQILCSTDYV